MKSAEDFRNAFGSADVRFELAVQNTLEDLQRQEEKTEQGWKRRYLFPAIAAIMIMMLGIGIAASNGRWGVLNWLSENRGESTGQQTVSETAEPFMAPIDMEYATITVREAQNDGYGMYLSVAFTPKEKGVLAFNWSINPFKDGPEVMGFTPDQKGQTLAEWAVQHGYHQLIRIVLGSMPEPSIPKELKTIEERAAYLDELGVPYRKTAAGWIVYDQVSHGPAFDSYINNRTFVEEDGTTLIMVAGNCIQGVILRSKSGVESPCLMNDDGTWDTFEPEWKIDDWRQGDIDLTVPVNIQSDPTLLIKYTGETTLMGHPDETIPVTVQLVRTELNDYIRIECADLQRSFQTPWLYLEDEITRFADSGIFSCAVQKNENKLIFTADCQIPDELPEQLIIRWFDSGYEVKIVVVKADK